MKDKVDFGQFGVLTWQEAEANMEISVMELLQFGETPEEDRAILEAAMNGCPIPKIRRFDEENDEEIFIPLVE